MKNSWKIINLGQFHISQLMQQKIIIIRNKKTNNNNLNLSIKNKIKNNKMIA